MTPRGGGRMTLDRPFPPIGRFGLLWNTLEEKRKKRERERTSHLNMRKYVRKA